MAMKYVTLQLRAKDARGLIGDALGVAGFAEGHVDIAEAVVPVANWEQKLKPLMRQERIGYKLNGVAYDGADW